MAKEEPLKVTREEFYENIESEGGYCENCREFTNFVGVKPNAVDVRCDDCGENTVVGAEKALELGMIIILGDHNDDPEE